MTHPRITEADVARAQKFADDFSSRDMEWSVDQLAEQFARHREAAHAEALAMVRAVIPKGHCGHDGTNDTVDEAARRLRGGT